MTLLVRTDEIGFNQKELVEVLRGMLTSGASLPAERALAEQLNVNRYRLRQALEHGVRVTGATVHFSDEGMDTGPIVLQAAVPIFLNDTEESLSRRILAEEHRIFPEAVRLFAEGRLRIDGRRVHIRESP